MNLDDELPPKAEQLPRTREKRTLVDQAQARLVEHESAQRLAKLDGSDPSATAGSRRS